MAPDTDPTQILVAKAVVVAERSMRRHRAPRTRQDLLDNAAVIRRRLRTGSDRVLKSAAGVSHYLEQEFALEPDAAKLMALAMLELVESYKG